MIAVCQCTRAQRTHILYLGAAQVILEILAETIDVTASQASDDTITECEDAELCTISNVIRSYRTFGLDA